MLEPDFSESQLQQAANTAFIRTIVEASGHWPFAQILSLSDEFFFGWDTAFYLDWLPHPPELNHAGCNFFIQYKLSNKYTSTGAAEWGLWNKEYFRFKIPHNSKDTDGKYFDDFHQWDRLKALADKNYPTYYATNATLKKSELISAYKAGKLLKDVPLLDVRTVKGLHKHVTFISVPKTFKLHSTLEELAITNFYAAVDSLRNEKQLTIIESNQKLISVLRDIGNGDENWLEDLALIDQYKGPFPNRLMPWAKYSALRSFIRKHVGADLFWIPGNILLAS